MNDEDRELLKSLGWTDELLEVATPSPENAAIDEWIRARTKKALTEGGVTALEWMSANPRVSVVELARRLNRGATGFGMELAIYHEAAEKGVFRKVAKELLIREILNRFPNGWKTDPEISAVVKIGGWDSGITNVARDSDFEKYADLIVRCLAIESPPQEGWIPEWPNDPLIDQLFDRYWPA